MNSNIRVWVRLLSQVAPIWVTWPITNAGVEMMSSEIPVTTRSETRYCRVAVQAPNATPSRMPSSVPISSRRRLTHIRVLISSATLTPNGEYPQSPRRTPLSHVQYRSASGTFSLRL